MGFVGFGCLVTMRRVGTVRTMCRRTRPSHVQHAFKRIKEGPLLRRQVGFGFDHPLREFSGHVFGQAGHRQHIALGQPLTRTDVDGPSRFFFSQQSSPTLAALGPTRHSGITQNRHGLDDERRVWTIELAFHHVCDGLGIVGAMGLVCVARKSQGTETQQK